jgi:Zn ribbon nucleic-acid-binding protein
MDHLANACPNEDILKLKEEERIKNVKCFKCQTWESPQLKVSNQEIGEVSSEASRRAREEAPRANQDPP